MKIVSRLLFFLCSTIPVLAQPVIQNSNLPDVGTVQYMNVAGPTDISPGLAFAEAQQWDFQGLSSEETRIIKFVHGDQTRGSYPALDSEIGRRGAFEDLAGFDLMGILAPLNFLDNLSVNEEVQGHAHYSVGEIGFGVYDRRLLHLVADVGPKGIFSIREETGGENIDMIARSYGDSVSCDGYYGGFLFDGASLYTIDVEIQKSHKADAFGTVLLPDGSFEVLRIKETAVYDMEVIDYREPFDITLVDSTFTVETYRFHSTETDYPVAIFRSMDEDVFDPEYDVRFWADPDQIDLSPSASFEYKNNCLTSVFLNTSQHGLQYHWDFGDGTSSTQSDPSHQYESEGSYTVSLTVEAPDGLEYEYSSQVNIDCSAICDFEYYEDCQNLYLYNTCINHEEYSYVWSVDGEVVNYDWDQIILDFDDPGTHLITLQVTGLMGETASESKFIEVLCEPAASFAFSSDCLNVNFANTSTNLDQSTWDFGDGTVGSNLDNPSHTFPAPGSYTVTLTVVSESGLENVYSSNVEIVCEFNGEFSIYQFPDQCDAFAFFESNPWIESSYWDFGNGSGSAYEGDIQYYDDGEYLITYTATSVWGEEVTTTQLLVVDCVTPVEASEPLKQVEVYPNPSAEVVIFSFAGVQHTNLQLEIFNADAQLVLSRLLTPTQSELSIQVAEFPAGQYFYSITDGEAVRIQSGGLVLME